MKTLYIYITAFMVCILTGNVFAQQQCITDDAQATNITYKVNGKPVTTLNGNVKQGSHVEVTFTTAKGTMPTKFSLVSYNAVDAKHNKSRISEYSIYDYVTEEVGPGTHTMEAIAPANYFEINFVRGCALFSLNDNENYEKSNRLIARANGGSKEKCKDCDDQKKVTICHVPKGNPANAHTITIAKAAAKAHIGRHGGDYYGECKATTPDTGSAQVTVDCESVMATATVNIQSITLLYDDSSTQNFVINARTANVAPTDEFEGYFIYGAYVQLEGEAGMGTFYLNPNFEVCEDERPPLPVKLTKFEAKKIAPSVVQLNWATAQEINNDYMAIEKSADIENWKEVCRVPGHGTSDQAHEYTCTDHQADEHGQNIVYYRPKQVDYNGTYEYFSTIRVRLQDAAYATTVDNVYPNPTKDRLNIRYNAAGNGVFNIRLVGMDGKALVQNRFVAKPGTQVIDIDLMENKLKPGVYLLEIHTENEVFHQKVYKQ